MSFPLDITGLLALLNTQQLVLVPNTRAAHRLRHHFDQQQQARGLQAWEPPNLLTWAEWTKSLWSTLLLQGDDDRILLNRLQEEALWTRIIADSSESPIPSPAGARDLAQLARSALQLAAAHEALPRLASSADSHEARTFVVWHRNFAHFCATNRLLPPALLESALAEHLRAHHLALPTTIHLAGFEDPTPAQLSLLHTLEAAGCTPTRHLLHTETTRQRTRGTVRAEDPRAQLRWAAQFLQQHFRDNPGTLGAAIILPDPAADRPALEALLREHLAPELEPIFADLSSTPWHFSTGLTLASLPFLQHTLLLLRWLTEDLPLASVGTLLLSPFLTHADDFETRTRFESHLRRHADPFLPEISLRKTLDLADRARSRNDPGPHLTAWRDLHRFTSEPRRLSSTATYADWTETIRRVLRLAGWPGPRTLSPAEFRATEAWDSLLDLLATLDLHGERVSFPEVLALIAREAATLPAPDTLTSVPVEVLRLPETKGCLFDLVLLLHATDSHLPQPEQPHPLLSWRLQQSLNLPGSNPALAHQGSRRALLSLSDRSTDLLLLSPAADEAGPLRPTPLAAELGFTPAATSLFPASQASLQIEPETLTDDAALPPLPSPMVSSGARVLELQAACGFRAFADLRLHASVPEKKTLGLDPRRSGNVLHRALELFWREVETQQALRALGHDGRRTCIQRCVTQALQGVAAQSDLDDPWAQNYLRVLEQRLATLLGHWLDHEMARADFTVLPPEQDTSISVGPLELKIRPDRIDKVDGGFVLVDYKTSSALNTNQWLGDRPDAPQLPLYALLGEAEEVLGLAFARLRPGKDMGWLSVQDRENLFPKKGSKLRNLPDQIELWRQDLNRLATDFAEGRADVDPKAYPSSCQYCDHRLLCRLDAATLLATEGNLDADLEPEEQDG